MSGTLIGTIVVGDGVVVRRELALLSRPGLSFLVDTFAYPPADVPFCPALSGILLAPALRLRDRGANVILVACTTALMQCPSVTDGLSAVIALPVVSIADAMIGVADAAGVRSLAIATPYGARNNTIIRTFFERTGFRIAALEGLDLDRSLDMWRETAQFLSDREVAALGRGVDRAEAEAICLPSSGIGSAVFAAHSEKLVLGAVAAGVWASLDRLGGLDRPSYRELLAMVRDATRENCGSMGQ